MANVIEVKNSREIQRRFRKLDEAVRDKIMVAAVMDGAEVIRQRTAQMAPKPAVRRHPEVTRLSESIIKVLTVRSRDRIQASVSPDRSKGKGGWYGHMVELGHKWWYGGFQGAKPFMGPAFEATKGPAMNVIKNRIQKETSRTTKSLNKEG